MKLTFLGTGTSTGVPMLGCKCRVCTSSDPRDRRTRPSVLLQYDGRTVMIDATPDFRQQGLRENIQRMDAVIFTHTHADHVFGLDDVRVFNFRQNGSIPIFADPRSMADIRRIFDYVFRGDYPYGGIPRLEPSLIEGDFDLWGQRFVPLPVLHGSLPILGFRFGGCAYVTDFSVVPDKTMALLEGVEILILDALRYQPHPSHSTVQQSLQLVERLQPRQAYFTHLAHDLMHEETNATLPPNVQLAYDGLQFEFDRTASPNPNHHP
jgi:phosphoribosyl 1,2-cyclic phosphate phosphodiesterase